MRKIFLVEHTIWQGKRLVWIDKLIKANKITKLEGFDLAYKLGCITIEQKEKLINQL